MTKARFINSTFKMDDPTWANACVGENGNPQIIEYANGFAHAANILIDHIINDEGKHLHVDEFIYPICFNMRHAVELYLKETIETLFSLAKYRRCKLAEFSLVSTHDLGIAWRYIKKNSELIDKRYIPQLKRLDGHISDIAEVDSSGQVFRYPFDTENRKHLIEIQIINVIVLQQRFNELQAMLSELNRLNNLLLNEYSWGSFTSKLSRVELFELASKLPKKSQWRTKEFIAAKATLRTEYGLSSNDFCRALDIIQDNYEMSQCIDATLSLQSVTEPILHTFFDGWIKLHPIEDKKNSVRTDKLHDEWYQDLQDYSKRKAEIEKWWHENGETFSSSHIAELKALFYFSIDYQYSEYFKFARENFNKNDDNTDQNKLKRSILHLLFKTSAMQDILKSLKFLGQTNLVNSVTERYSFQS